MNVLQKLVPDSALNRQQFAITYLIFIINGFVALSVGTLAPFIQTTRGLNYAFIGLLLGLHSAGNLISSFFAGILPRIIGKKLSMVAFNIAITAAFALILFTNSNLLLAVAFTLTGLARGATSNYSNFTINTILPGKAWAINGLHAMFAIGAFTFPLVLTIITRYSASYWIYGVIFMLIMGVISNALYILLPLGDLEKAKAGIKGSNSGFLKEPLFYLICATLFFYLGAEQGVIGWMVTYFRDTEIIPPNLAPITSSLLWVMILAGRLITAWISTKVRKTTLLLVMGTGIVGFFVLLILSSTTIPVVIGIMGFGLMMAGVYPTTVSIASGLMSRFPVSWSVILTVAGAGATLAPIVVGFVAESFGIVIGLSTIGVSLVVVLALILALKIHLRPKAIVRKSTPKF